MPGRIDSDPAEDEPMRSWALAGVALLIFAGAPMRAEDRVLRAGAATSNITPPLGEPIVGNFKTPKATHVHDELHARCLVLDDGTTTLAFAICDNVGIGRAVFDAARKLVHDELGLPENHL